MRISIAVGLAACVSAALLASGCGSGSGGPARPTKSGLAPPITLDQLSVAKYVDKPCDLLRTDRQLLHRLVPPGAVEHPTAGPAVCRWASTLAGNPAFLAGVDVSRGLEDRYRQRAGIGYFQPTDISSYPAIHTTPEPSGPAHGHCTTEVGVADRALLLVTVDYGRATGVNSADPCADADTIALAIMGELKAAGA